MQRSDTVYSFKLKVSIDNSGVISQKLVVGVVNADRRKRCLSAGSETEQ